MSPRPSIPIEQITADRYQRAAQYTDAPTTIPELWRLIESKFSKIEQQIDQLAQPAKGTK